MKSFASLLFPRAVLASLCATFATVGAWAQNVSLNGCMGDRAALLLIDGQPRTLAVGASAQGVKLLKVSNNQAQVEIGSQVLTLNVGGAPGRVGGSGSSRFGGSSIVLTAGLGGHFTAQGAINGRPVRFLVDTGATNVSLPQSEADRIGLDYRHGQPVMANTANGAVQAYLVTLTTVRVGDVEVANVPAIVVPAYMDHVLLGNSFLTRFSMLRESDVMRLEKRP